MVLRVGLSEYGLCVINLVHPERFRVSTDKSTCTLESTAIVSKHSSFTFTSLLAFVPVRGRLYLIRSYIAPHQHDLLPVRLRTVKRLELYLL